MGKKVTTRNPYDRTNPYTGKAIANGAVNNVYPELMLVGKVPTSIPALATNGLFSNTAKRVGTTILKGIGTVKKVELLKKFGTVENISNASVEEIAEVKGINEELAVEIKNALIH